MRFAEIVQIPLAPVQAFRRAFFPGSKKPLRRDVVRAREIGARLFVKIGLVAVFLLVIGEQLVPSLLQATNMARWKEISDGVSRTLIVMLAFVAFEVLVAERESVEGPKDISVPELGDEFLRTIDPRDGFLQIDLIGYSAETYHSAFNQLRDAVKNRACPLRRLSVRLLIWDCGGHPVVPRKTRNGEMDAVYLANVRRRRQYPIAKIRQTVNEIERAGVKVEFQCRFSPFEPSLKAAIVNRARVYWCLYSIEKHEQTFPDQVDENWDFEGFGVLLSEAIIGSAAYTSVENWFNKIWDHFSIEHPRD